MIQSTITKLAFSALILSMSAYSSAHAANIKVTVQLGTLTSVDSVNAVTSNGKVFAGTRRGNNITIKIPSKSFANSSLYATKAGKLVGPVYAKLGQKGLLFFAKKPVNARGAELTSFKLKLREGAADDNYIMANLPKGTIYAKRHKYTPEITPVLGFNATGTSSVKRVVAFVTPAGDRDADGVVDALDVDVDGDGISNIADTFNQTASLSSRLGTKADTNPDVPFTALYLSMGDTLNWHINGALSQTEIDDVVGGENKFAIAYFFALPPGDTSGIAGGHVVCAPELTYCRPTVGAETGSAIYSGLSESDPAIKGLPWSQIDTDGHEYSLEQISIGGSADTVFAAAVQPRVGTSVFKAGDTYLVNFTNDSGDTISSKTLTLPPYFLTVPAVRAYNTSSNDSSGDTVVDYSNSSGPGMNSGNPIVLDNSGPFAGKLRLSIWRLQRGAVLPDETGNAFRDFGHLNYGVLINNNSGEFTCGELYSNLSASLTESPSQGQGGSYSSQQGALLWPLVDSSDDYEPSNDSGARADNTIEFTVDLSACLARNGLSAGVHQITVIAAGSDTGHGANRAAQMITVNIP